jgi:hypothetical protein
MFNLNLFDKNRLNLTIKTGEKTMISIERIAMQLRGKDDLAAEKMLERYGFSLGELSEIITCCTSLHAGVFKGSIKQITNSITSTLECSMRIGDRLPDAIKYDKINF